VNVLVGIELDAKRRKEFTWEMRLSQRCPLGLSRNTEYHIRAGKNIWFTSQSRSATVTATRYRSTNIQ